MNSTKSLTESYTYFNTFACLIRLFIDINVYRVILNLLFTFRPCYSIVRILTFVILREMAVYFVLRTFPINLIPLCFVVFYFFIYLFSCK